MDQDGKKASLAKIAKVGKLAPFSDLSMIDNFGKAYGLHPDKVYAETAFDTVIQLARMWKEQVEYHERKADIERMMSAKPESK